MQLKSTCHSSFPVAAAVLHHLLKSIRGAAMIVNAQGEVRNLLRQIERCATPSDSQLTTNFHESCVNMFNGLCCGFTVSSQSLAAARNFTEDYMYITAGLPCHDC